MPLRTTRLAYFCAAISFAQPPRPPAVASPEIGSDRTVTFRIYAPKAAEVLVTGDWMGRTDKPIALSKQDDGIWVATAGPFEPNTYFYAFTVNGVRSADPVNNETIVLGGRFPQSRLEIRGDTSQPCGSGDLLLPGNRRFSEVLQQKTIEHTFKEIHGFHSTPTFRAQLIEFAQVLFR